MTEKDCVFCKIVEGKLPSKKEYEDENFVVFHDIHPSAPVHLLIVPKEHFEWQGNLRGREEALGRIFTLGPKLAEKVGIKKSGFRISLNCGAGAGQVISHFHVHLLGGWPEEGIGGNQSVS